ncbi:MAG: glutamate-5-semialdehyde dehydrogenase [Planctomycetes bacterium]|nr:glutamate-5-semialdehyde dehydrogenase [Planctomycetota bacterium]
MTRDSDVALDSYCDDLGRRSAASAPKLQVLSAEVKNAWLVRAAAIIRGKKETLCLANEQDLESAEQLGLSPSQIDRLRLDNARIETIAQSLESVARMADPIGEIIEGQVRPNGLRIQKMRVPLGVVFFIYESRPNVTADAAALCLKSGNAVILRGGKEAKHSNYAVYHCLHEALIDCELPEDAIQIVETTDRDAVSQFLGMTDYIDLVIPRGGKALIARVARDARVPVLKHYEGNCHVYVDADANLSMASEIVLNAKCNRPGVCNAAESLLIHQDMVHPFLGEVLPRLQREGVELRVCSESKTAVDNVVGRWKSNSPVIVRLATDADYYCEFLDLILSVKVVHSLEEAVNHINHYGSGHTDAIVTSSWERANQFTASVDSSAVMVNASTRFNDGGEFGLGAEIGISTDKFHARGPCGLRELTSYKWVVHGAGHIRN